MEHRCCMIFHFDLIWWHLYDGVVVQCILLYESFSNYVFDRVDFCKCFSVFLDQMFDKLHEFNSKWDKLPSFMFVFSPSLCKSNPYVNLIFSASSEFTKNIKSFASEVIQILNEFNHRNPINIEPILSIVAFN